MKKIDKFENNARICSDIENLVISKHISYMDAAILYSEEKNLEIEQVAIALSKNSTIRIKIENEANELNFLKKKE